MSNLKLFKRINPRFFKNDKKFSKSSLTLRTGIYDQLERQEYASGLTQVSKDERIINVMNLGQLVRRVLQNAGVERSVEHTNFKPTMPSSDVLYNLIGKKGNNIDIRDLNNMDLILNQYDYMFHNPRFYYNTNGAGPLRTFKVVDMIIIFRGYSEIALNNFLKNVSYDLGEYFSFAEPYFIGFTSSFRLKEEIVLRYCRHDLKVGDVDQRAYQEIVEDAYNDLRRISSLNCDESLIKREEMLENIRDQFYDNYMQSLKNGYYTIFSGDWECEQYNNLFKEFEKGFNHICQCISGNSSEMPYNIKKHYVFDQKMQDGNKFKIDYGYIKNQVMDQLYLNKVIRSVITQIHPDVVSGIFLLIRHLKMCGLWKLYYRGSVLVRLISLLISQKLRLKPLVIKLGFKNICDGLLHDMKEKGLINCHQIENFFGYRVGVTIKDEIKEDYMNWFNKGLDKYGETQYQFIKKWAPSFFASLNFKGRQIGEIIRENLSHYPSFEKILGNDYQFMSGHGVVGDKLVETTTGKKKSISKNLYFKLFEDPTNLDINDYSKRNKVIIKREELIKQRIVINSTMRTFPSLAKINRFLSTALANTGIVYVFNNKSQKADNYVRLQNYLLYNKVLRKRYLCVPLDYSSYDHTITKKFIRGVIEVIGDYTGYGNKLNELYNQFDRLLEDEVIYFKELEGDEDNNQKYKYGMLSGWKITSSVESIGNAIISYGVMNELGLELVDLETMGDDLIIVLEKENQSRDQQLELLTRICAKYTELGFEMNVPKNSIGYYFLEFLRVTFRPGSVQCYPTRILGSLVYIKPGKEEENFSIIEVQSVIRKICKRYGCGSRYFEIGEYFLPAFYRQDIARYGVMYLKNQGLFSLNRVEKVKYEYKIGNLRDTPIFKFYSSILGDGFDELIESIISDFIVKKTVTLTYIVPRGSNRGFSENEVRYLKYIVGLYKKQVDRDLSNQKLYIPDYHLGILVIRILKKLRKNGIVACRDFLDRVNRSMYRVKLIRLVDFNQNMSVIRSIDSVNDAILRIETDRVLVTEENIPSLIFSKIKKDFINFLNSLLGRYSLSDFGRSIVKSILKKNKNYIVKDVLGVLLASKSEVIGAFDGLPIGWMCD